MLDPAWLTLAALAAVIAVSCTNRVNPGLVAIVLAWLIGIVPASLIEKPIGLKAVTAGFPSSLFLTLTGVTLLFGGDSGTVLADLWAWNGTTWTNVTPATGSPPARYGHAMVYDVARDRTVVFGGTAGINYTDYLADIWEWDGAAWTNATPMSGPIARSGHGMTYDTTAGRVVMFGGGVGGLVRNDTWAWNGAIWTDITASSSPGGRIGHGMAYDSLHGEAIVVGGFGGGNETLRLRLERTTTAIEGCRFGLDGDDDGLVGCSDPDCFGVCAPLCNPTESTSCDPALPQCGDATCSAVEGPRVCPADCGAPSLVCGDGLCDPGETAQGCPGDCP